jgi:hypothetical protein
MQMQMRAAVCNKKSTIGGKVHVPCGMVHGTPHTGVTLHRHWVVCRLPSIRDTRTLS